MLSVVIATLDRAPLLQRVLDRLDRQKVGNDAFEVLIGADAAEPDLDAVRATAGNRAYEVRVFQASTPGVSAARNSAWPSARSDVVLFIGDDMLPAPDLLGRHLAHHRRDPRRESGLIGHVRWARELKTTPFMRWLDDGMQFDFASIPGSQAGWWHFLAANGSLKKEMLERVGGFDESFRFGYEEMDLAYRMHQLGFTLRYDARAEVEHLHPPTIEGWKRRMTLVARAERQFVERHPGIEPYFLPIFEAAVSKPPLRGRAIGVSRFLPRWLPRVGPRVWDSVDVWFAQQLAPSFLNAWHALEGTPSRSPQVGGSQRAGQAD